MIEDAMDSWALLAGAVMLVAYLAWLMREHRREQSSSKDPKTWPLLGAQLEVMANLERIHDWFASFFSDEHRTVTLHTMSSTMYLTVDPHNVEHILKTGFHNYPKGERVHSRLHDFLGDGIFNSDGNVWKKHRKIASVEFSNRKLREMSTVAFRDDALRLLHILQAASLDAQQSVDMQDLFMRMTMDSICKVGFGVDMGNISASLSDVPFGKAFDNVNAVITYRLINPIWKLQRALNVGNERVLTENMAILNSFTSDIIQKRKAEIAQQAALGNDDEGRADLLSRFISYNAGQQGAYNDAELRDALLNFMIAGRDTTAIALSWFLYCVCMNPHVGEKVYKEGLEVLSLEGKEYSFQEVADKIDYESLNKMHYLHAALTETLRLYPPVPRDGKTVLHDDVLPDGTHVKQGNQISYLPYAMGRMEFLWGKNAMEYNPERWLKDGVFQPESPFKFSAFQAGPRICLGKDSAYLQLKMTAALVLHFFRFKMVPGHVVHYRLLMVMPMINGLLVHVSSR